MGYDVHVSVIYITTYVGVVFVLIVSKVAFCGKTAVDVNDSHKMSHS